MKILALDTAVTGCGVAILDGESAKCVSRVVETERGQAEMLVPLIEELAQESGVPLSEIDRVAVTIGPGSFTGVRIGLATARSLALSLDIPVIGFTTLDVIARQTQGMGERLVLIDTKRGDFYGQEFGADDKALSEPRIWSEGNARGRGGVIIENKMPSIEILAKMGADQSIFSMNYDSDAAPTPLYLREAEVSEPKRKIAPLSCAQ
jgi:tRNA threonylcarbamoyladenosine biosynthesis protein TsaB